MKRNWKERTISATLESEFLSSPEAVWRVLTTDETGETPVSADPETFAHAEEVFDSMLFRMEEKTELERYRFTLKNGYLTGDYDCRLSPLEGGGTRVTFSDSLRFHHLAAFLIAAIGMPIKKSQKIRVEGLKKRLGENGQ